MRHSYTHTGENSGKPLTKDKSEPKDCKLQLCRLYTAQHTVLKMVLCAAVQPSVAGTENKSPGALSGDTNIPGGLSP